MRLLGPMLFVVDLVRMTRFYRDGLGLRPVTDSELPGWVELNGGEATLALHAIPAELAQTILIDSPPEARADVPVKLRFATADLAQARDHLTACGAVMLDPSPWGTCDGIDPEGNVFQIVQT